jgi:hypothetical protein
LVRIHKLPSPSMTSDSRSVGEQVKSGFLIAGELVGGLFTFLMATKGIVQLYSSAPSRHFGGPLTAWLELCVAIVVIFATAERWGGYIPGFFFLRGFFGGIIHIISPSSADAQGLTRLEGAVLAIYSIALLGILWRFIPPRRVRATLLDRMALTIFALSVASMWALPRATAMGAPLFGSIPLLIAWGVYRWKLTHDKKKLSYHQVGPNVPIARVEG